MDPKEVSQQQHETTPPVLAPRGRIDNGRPERFTVAQVRAAIVQWRGCLALVARALGCSRAIVQQYCARHAELQEQVDQARERVIDQVEVQLRQRVKNGDRRAIAFVLNTLGKPRGWAERADPRVVEQDLSALSVAERQVLRPILAKLYGPGDGAWPR